MSRVLTVTVGAVLLGGCAESAVDPWASVRTQLASASRTAPGETTAPVPQGARLVSYAGPAKALTEPTGSSGADWTQSWDERPAGDDSSPSVRRKPLPSFWGTVKRDVKEMPEVLWKDTKAVYTSTPNLLLLGLSYGGALAVQETGPDRTVEDHFRDHHIFAEDARNIFAAAGNPGTHFALAGAWYLLGQQAQDEETYEVGRTLFSALIINGMSTLVGQAATWDRAPNGEMGTFPSGHTSSTFTVASVMHEAYGPWVGAPLYGLGVLVAMERLEDGEHYLADVLMGGVMGLVIGHTVAGEHEFELFGGKIVPYVDPATASSGIAWVKHF
ncbi:MAG: phosphatase PAP2 family protein [bacterium]|nr:phosphatase PAP2 family protein [bacterium]